MNIKKCSSNTYCVHEQRYFVDVRFRRLQLTAGVQVSTTGSGSSNNEQRSHSAYGVQCRRHHHHHHHHQQQQQQHHHHSQNNNDNDNDDDKFDRYSDDNDSVTSYQATAARRCCTNNGRRSCHEDGSKLCTGDDCDDEWRDAHLAEDQANVLSTAGTVDDVDTFDHHMRNVQSCFGQLIISFPADNCESICGW